MWDLTHCHPEYMTRTLVLSERWVFISDKVSLVTVSSDNRRRVRPAAGAGNDCYFTTRGNPVILGKKNPRYPTLSHTLTTVTHCARNIAPTAHRIPRTSYVTVTFSHGIPPSPDKYPKKVSQCISMHITVYHRVPTARNRLSLLSHGIPGYV